MIIRSINTNDYREIREIYEKFYTREFDFPDFFTNFFSAFVVINDSGQIITVAGLRTIAEVIMMTNLDISVRTRVEALKEVKLIANNIATDRGYNRLHAVVYNPVWARQLLKSGFTQHPGDFLIY